MSVTESIFRELTLPWQLSVITTVNEFHENSTNGLVNDITQQTEEQTERRNPPN